MFVVTSDEKSDEKQAEEAREDAQDAARGRTEAQRNAVRLRRVGRLERRWWGRKVIAPLAPGSMRWTPLNCRSTRLLNKSL